MGGRSVYGVVVAENLGLGGDQQDVMTGEREIVVTYALGDEMAVHVATSFRRYAVGAGCKWGVDA